MNAHKMAVRTLGVAALVAVCLMAGQAAAGPYTIIDLGDLGGGMSQGFGLSSDGRVAGVSYPAGQATTKGFYWNGGPMVNIGTLADPSVQSRAEGVNRYGVVAGTSVTSGSFNYHAVRYDSATGVLQDIHNIGGGYSQGMDINDAGYIVGRGFIPNENAFIWDSVGGMRSMGTLPGGSNSWAEAISETNDVTGWSTYTGSGGYYNAFFVENAAGTPVWTRIGMFDGHQASTGRDVNDLDQVVGDSWAASGGHRAFLWQKGGSMIDFTGLDGSYAYGINNAGQIVGYVGNHAYVYDIATDTLTYLDTLLEPGSGWQLTWATSINDAGQITGFGSHNGQTHAFLLTPEQVAVPEPASVVFFATGVAGMFGLVVRRRMGRRQR